MRQVISKDDKAVSPIIATILLIAITVVLAATLVTILGGFTKGASGTAATASATTNFEYNSTSSPGSTNVYLNVSAFSTTGISNSKIAVILTLTNNTGTFTYTGNLASITGPETVVISSTQSTFTGGSDYTIYVHNAALTSATTSITVQLTYSGSVVYTSGTVT
jgi:flagellin-like protein